MTIGGISEVFAKYNDNQYRVDSPSMSDLFYNNVGNQLDVNIDSAS
jgi:hypothetical protein